jgi:putative ABC transport system permease protein
MRIIGDLVFDLRHGARGLRRAPTFTATAVLTMALGIGACAAIFSVVDAVLLRPLPFPDADRLVALGESHPPEFPHFAVRPMTFPQWKAQQRSFEGLAVVRDGS